jgi:L-ascorbate metabolism protein UlaG (beta-lactamase superfamily)
MTRHLAVCLVSLAVVSAAVGADAKKPTLTWHGQSFFELVTSQGTRVVFDPHAIEEFGRKTVSADLVLLSHLHPDHIQLGVLENRDKAKVLAGLSGSGRKTSWNPVNEAFRDVRVRTVPTFHDTQQGMQYGLNAVWVVEADGLRFAHLGDLGHKLSAEQLKQIGPVDVVLVPVGGVYSLNGSEAQQVVAQLKPRRFILPMHYGTPVYDQLLTVDEFLDDQKPENVRVHSLIESKQFPRQELTNQLTIDPAAAPAEPVIVVLHWK